FLLSNFNNILINKIRLNENKFDYIAALSIFYLQVDFYLYEGRFLIVFYQTEFKPIVSTNHQSLMSNFWQVADRKSTRLNSSHVEISYAVFCLKKKKTPRLLRAERNTAAGPGTMPLPTRHPAVA